MTPLEAYIRARIAKHGPLSVQQFMEDALAHPDFGYYMTRDPLGARGDFVTAPEISQIFGELIGAWLASVWQSMGSPAPVRLIELGPGRGTLMADALRAADGVPGFADAIRLALVEASPVLRERQAACLDGKTRAPIAWYRDVSQIDPGPSLIVANEFFDALPIRQYVRDLGQWRERLVEPCPGGDGLRFVLAGETAKPHMIPAGIVEAANGDIVEHSPAGLRCMHTLAARLTAHVGAALIVDYGHVESAIGETLQAVQGHAYAGVLSNPGEQDLTAHVDFAALARVASDADAAVAGPVTQAAFLSRLGIDIRLQRLLGNAAVDSTAAGLVAGARRLIDPEAMGNLFKVMAVTSPSVPNPAGFEG